MFVPGGSGNGGNGRPVADPFGGIPKELRPNLTHLLMAAAIMHQQSVFSSETMAAQGISQMSAPSGEDDAVRLARPPVSTDAGNG
jgi:hypothetical protein